MRLPARSYAPLLVLGLLAAVAAAPRAAEPPRSRLERLAWMTGSWVWDSAGARSEEHWMGPVGGLMVGMNRTVRGGRARAFEFLRIRERGDTVAYLSMPNGRGLTEFALKEIGDRRVVFENLEHDFPQRVIYWLGDDGRLHARIEGQMDGQLEGQNWVWKRDAAPPEEPPTRPHE